MAARRPIEIAQELDRLGLNVLPAKFGGKTPVISWKQFEHARTTSKLTQWFSGASRMNYWVACGSVSGVVVLDCDSDEAETYWRQELGDLLDQTARVRTRKGHHFYFRLEPGDVIASWSHHDAESGVSFDVRAEGTGVIVPPSVHQTGHVYEWERGMEHIAALPKALRGPGKSLKGSEAPVARSMLAELLSRPPDTGGRNNWMARVAGHYAKHFRRMRDAYEANCRMANSGLGDPLAEAEFIKTIDSIWESEQEKGELGGTASPDNGWLVPGENCLLVQCRVKKGEEFQMELQEWGDFDIRAIGVVEDDHAARAYDVVVRRQRQADERVGILKAADLSDPRRLRGWLAEYGVSVIQPDQAWPKSGSISERLTRYVESQEPPHFQVVPYLGWHGDGFVTHEGVIRSDGLHGFDRRKPDPKLLNWAPYRYGFVDNEVAREVLREVLTFHDETVCSVYGAWWAACLLKPQIHDVVSQFPFMALQAPSESGKTTGFFSLMMQLNGNTQGQVELTPASLRDWMSGHQSGIVWIDDLSDSTYVMDRLRQATGEGSVGKKGEDRQTQELVRLVAPISISGEALKMGGQKALLDRAVRLSVPSPTQRRSLKDPGQLQWVDVVALRRRFPDLTVMAGSIVQMALQHSDLVHEIPRLVPGVGGRWGDKIAIVRMGARLLAGITGDPTHVSRVESWVGQQDSMGSENTLTLRLVPTALAQTGWKSEPDGPEGRWPATPAFVSGGTVWFSPTHLARWWWEMQHGRIEERTESEEALTEQARDLGLGGGDRAKKASNRGPNRRRWKLGGDPNRKSIYWAMDEELSAAVVSRSRGEGGVSGVHPGARQLGLWATTHPEKVEEPV